MTLHNHGICSKRRQRGAFAIELAFVMMALCAVYLFSTDLSHQLLVRAKLDRSSFALANVIKERTRYFDADVAAGKNLTVTSSDLVNLTQVASRMLNTAPGNVALKIESLTNKTTVVGFTSNKFNSLNCQTDSLQDHADLAPVEKGVIFPLYRVSICQQQHSWFEPFINGGTSTTVKIVSSSIMPGR
ncbi:tight adherence pilus pseudopilin TadF [Vibrio barjaei]|jgi:tight adherence protein F|uniref:Tight adherence pilus pseudopilin TadF n=1 Tax=Vibrio barjaei TaxID=1676683 RepID=A0ABW7II38_9VIBR|nr:tight adherence pilus pseudopilin TadF [Vibrio barjaei]MCG9787143.1 membrane associated secretion system protein [Vibrio mediterranei]MCY9873323.1 tight adherence pilus pseudopilin TadF [Vibrio barjaei]OIN25698.1 membrane associated secretion system protein [Vibrio barjaei]